MNQNRNNQPTNFNRKSCYKKIISFCLLPSAFCLLSSIAPKKGIAADLKEITDRGKIIIAVKDNLPPLGFQDEKGNLQGLEIDIARQLAQELLGSKDAVDLQPVANQDRLKLVLEGKVDLAIARVTATSSRSRVVDFSRYYYLDGTGLVTKDVSVRQLSDLSKAKIAVLKDSSTIAIVQNKLPNARLIGVESYQEALNLLEMGAADAFAGDRSLITGWVQEYPQYHQLAVNLSGEALCIVMPRGLQYQDLHQQVDRAIALWQKSGWLQERVKYWGLP